MFVPQDRYRAVNHQNQTTEEKETSKESTPTSASRVDDVGKGFFNNPDNKLSSLHTAVLAGSVESVRMGLKNGEDVNARDFVGWSLLHLAIGTSRLAILRELLNTKNVNLELRTKGNQETPLLMAARMNYLNGVDELLEAGADVNAQNSQGWSSAHWAALFNNLRMLDSLVKHKANLELRTEGNQQTPLLMAADMQNSEIMHALLKAKEDADAHLRVVKD